MSIRITPSAPHQSIPEKPDNCMPGSSSSAATTAEVSISPRIKGSWSHRIFLQFLFVSGDWMVSATGSISSASSAVSSKTTAWTVFMCSVRILGLTVLKWQNGQSWVWVNLWFFRQFFTSHNDTCEPKNVDLGGKPTLDSQTPPNTFLMLLPPTPPPKT